MSTPSRVGGQHVTMDIARGLTTAIADAERLKTLYGAALSGRLRRPRHDLACRRSARTRDEPPRMVPRAQLVRIIRPRVEEILEMVRDRLDASRLRAPIRAAAWC